MLSWQPNAWTIIFKFQTHRLHLTVCISKRIIHEIWSISNSKCQNIQLLPCFAKEMKVSTNGIWINAVDYSHYALLATERMNNDFHNWNAQTPSHGKHFQIGIYMKYGHNKQFKLSNITAAAVLCKINEGEHQWNMKKCGWLFTLCSSGNRVHGQ